MLFTSNSFLHPFSKSRSVTQKRNQGSVSRYTRLHKKVTKTDYRLRSVTKNVTKVDSWLRSVTQKRDQGWLPVTLDYNEGNQGYLNPTAWELNKF